MYLVREADVERWRDYNGLTFLRCACRFTEAQEKTASERSAVEGDSKRLETKRLIAELKKTNPFVEANLFKATQNVVLNKVLGYKLHGEAHSFLEDY